MDLDLAGNWQSAQACEFDVNGGIREVFARKSGIDNGLSCGVGVAATVKLDLPTNG